MTVRRNRLPRAGNIPNYVDGMWTGPDVWTTGNGEPSTARLHAEQLGYDWQAHRIETLFKGEGDI